MPGQTVTRVPDRQRPRHRSRSDGAGDLVTEDLLALEPRAAVPPAPDVRATHPGVRRGDDQAAGREPGLVDVRDLDDAGPRGRPAPARQPSADAVTGSPGRLRQ